MICPGCFQEHADGGTCPPGSGVVIDDPLIGTTLGDYGLVRELGRGSGGVVYLAEHLATGLNVAIKLAQHEHFPDAGVGRRMAREARFANQIALESVVNVFDFSDDHPLGPYIVMEYLQGEPLLNVATQRLSPSETLELVQHAAQALGEAHDRHIVHAGLEPSNVFRTQNDRRENLAKLLPFGVPTGARLEGEEPGDRDVARLGSPDFRPPEQTLGAPADPRMDVYSLGAIAYLLVTGRAPFSAPTIQALERAHAEVIPAAPHRVDPRVSRNWSTVIMRALEKAPDHRYQSAREFAAALRAAPARPEPVTSAMFVLEGLSPSTPPPVTVPPDPAPASDGLTDVMIITTTPIPNRPVTPIPGSRISSTGRIYDLPIATPNPSSPRGLSTPAPTQGLVLRVAVSDERGQALGDFACSSVTRAGLLVCTPGPFPTLLSRVKLHFADLGGLSCEAQVVNHVTAEQATQWKMSAGYGVQFGALSAEQRTLLETAHQGLKQPETPSGLAARPDDPAAEEILRRFAGERGADGYAILAISKAAPFDAIRDRIRDVRRVLESLSGRPLSLAQQKAFQAARARLDEVAGTLGEPISRLEYDAARGNFEGVARCISAGVSVTELETARLQFLKTHPGVAGKSHGSILAGQMLEARQQTAQALEAYAEALRADPLNLTAQQRYWAVRRQLDKA